MRRIVPPEEYIDEPCSIVSIGCATNCHLQPATSHADGYMTLRDMNSIIRKVCSVRQRTNYKRGQRPKLKDLHINGRAIVCVLGHFVYVEGETYWSFFDNEEDEVVSVWHLN